ncbi:chemotaxis response regulator CheY1 [Pedobacter jeongneungensis]|jgi:DNA-binding response OmpR family regulator|uniref:Two-component system response regulator n=2 Tax=Pedobacter TaxID=84567 RepID=A0A366LD34_9SPHI|nr:response regulator [Pedobacter miscanthi]RBQ11807.1 two-component system response regulator [Pedobacter miscanthi]
MKNLILKNNVKKYVKKHILLVDGGLDLGKLLNFILAPEYKLTIKTNGIDALSWLEEGNDPDLVISSLRMPFFDGSVFIQSLKCSGFYRNTPVMLLSGEENLEDKIKNMSVRIDSYMEKPFDPAILKNQISRLIA